MPWISNIFRKWNYSTSGWTGDAASNIGIEAGRHDSQDDDFADGINACLKKDATNAAFSTDLNFNGNKPTNIAAGTAAVPALCVGNDTNTGVFGPASDTWAVSTGGTERVRVDSTGKLGIGTSTPERDCHLHNASGNATLHITNNTTGTTATDGFDLVCETTTNVAYVIQRENAPLVLRTNNLDRVIIDGNGDAGIGASVPAGGGTRFYVKKDVSGYGGITVDNTDQRLTLTSNFVSGVNQFGSIQAAVVSTGAVNKLSLNPLGGNVLINKQSDVVTGSGTFFTQAAANYPALLINTKDFSGSVNVLQNHHAGTYVGGINYTNTATSFPTSSDYRLKENVVPVSNALQKLSALKPCSFNFKIQPDETIDGFLAHEVAAVVPNAVDGVKDAVNDDGSIKVQSLDNSKLVPLLTASLQELLAKVEALEAKLEATEVVCDRSS